MPKTATIYTKASIYKVQQVGTVVTIDVNASLSLDVVDDNPDMVGFTLLSSEKSTLYYSSNQWLLSRNTWKTVPQAVKAGIITVN